jgi:hypothetical protein
VARVPGDMPNGDDAVWMVLHAPPDALVKEED